MSEHEDQSPIVLGMQMAEADAAQRRHEAQEHGASPLAGIAYRGTEHRLWRFVPSATDDTIADLVDRYAEASDEERGALTDSLTMDDFYTLLSYARRAAVRALRAGDPAIARSGLHAIAAMDTERLDIRDAWVAIPIVQVALGEVGADPISELAGAMDIAHESIVESFQRFADDPVDREGLRKEWGQTLVRRREGMCLIPCDFQEYQPRVDLVEVGILVAETVDADRYFVGDVTTASDLPEVWFSSGTLHNAPAAITRVRGTVRVSADLRPEHGPADQGHSLLVLLTDAHDEADAGDLQAAAAATRRQHETLCVRAGSLLAVVVAWSWLGGVEPIETPATLERLRTPIAAALQNAPAAGSEGS